MPQMSPLWWEVLFLLFLMMYFLVNIMSYFSVNKSIVKNENSKKKPNQLNWTW
nr:ATP synthase F0 subunit 8 [Tholosanus proximus]QVD38904.1 ATP synthase F0 subunit 8 [Tholosanus proximus]